MEYFNFVGAIIACILAILKIIDLINNRPIIKIAGSGVYSYEGDKKTLFNYSIKFENIGRRPAIIRDMQIDLLDNKKKTLNIHSRVEDINRKLECPDIFEKRFEYKVDKKLPSKVYFIEARIQSSGKKHRLRIKMQWMEAFFNEVYEEIEAGRKKGLLE